MDSFQENFWRPHMKYDSLFADSFGVLSPSRRNKGRVGHRVVRQPEPVFENAKRTMLILRIACVLLLALSMMPRLGAQIAAGGVTGTVRDASGAAIPNAQVALTNDETGVVQVTRSTSSATYGFSSVPGGTYTLRAQGTGFEDFVIKGIEVHVQVVLTEDATLSVGTEKQEVTVTAAAPLLQAENASIGTTIGSQQIVDLPLNGRNWASL